MNHLKPFEARAKKRDDQGDYWWEHKTKCAYYPEFEKEKVVCSKLLDRNQQFVLVEPECFMFTESASFFDR